MFAAGPNVGKNTVASMAVVVSCLNASNQIVNVMTPAFPVSVAPATDVGCDGEIEARVTLPAPCIAPIVFVTNAAGTTCLAIDGLSGATLGCRR